MHEDDHGHLTRIELVPAPGPKEHAADHSYSFVAPLSLGGTLDLNGWKAKRALCFVHRVGRDGDVRHGLLVHRAGGTSGSTWVFDYELGRGEEEAGFRFETHRFIEGAYVAIRDEDGLAHTFRVASVKPA